MSQSFVQSALAVIIVLQASCGSDRSGPTDPAPRGPGAMLIRVVERPESVRLLRLQLQGPVDEVISRLPHDLWQRTDSTGVRTLLIRGPLDDVIVWFSTEEREAEFRVTVTGLAASGLGGYAVLPDSAVRLVIEPE